MMIVITIMAINLIILWRVDIQGNLLTIKSSNINLLSSSCNNYNIFYNRTRVYLHIHVLYIFIMKILTNLLDQLAPH